MAKATIADQLKWQIRNNDRNNNITPGKDIIESKARWNGDLYQTVFHYSNSISNIDEIIEYANKKVDHITSEQLSFILDNADRSIMKKHLNTLREKIGNNIQSNSINEFYRERVEKSDNEMLDILFQLGYQDTSAMSILYGIYEPSKYHRVTEEQEQKIINYLERITEKYGKNVFVQNHESYHYIIQKTIEYGLFSVLDYIKQTILNDQETSDYADILTQETVTKITQALLRHDYFRRPIPILDSSEKFLQLTNFIQTLPNRKN